MFAFRCQENSELLMIVTLLLNIKEFDCAPDSKHYICFNSLLNINLIHHSQDTMTDSMKCWNTSMWVKAKMNNVILSPQSTEKTK